MNSPALEALLDELADRIADRVAVRTSAPDHPADDAGWMNSGEAARYLGITRAALHKHTSARTIPFEQRCRGGRLYFRRADLDEWQRRGQRFQGASTDRKWQ